MNIEPFEYRIVFNYIDKIVRENCSKRKIKIVVKERN